MAIFHLNFSIISRKKGRSSTGAAAYRAAEKIQDERTQSTFDYTQKAGVYTSEILSPQNAPHWVHQRSRLWNEVEKAERRKDAVCAREIVGAIPNELNYNQRIQLVQEFIQDNFIAQGMVVDISYHNFETHNPHFHALATTRTITSHGFELKNRDWDKRQFLIDTRQAWAHYTNQALERYGYDARIDHRTLEEQGIQRIPQIHLGPKVIQLETQGIRTERGDLARWIDECNQQIEHQNSTQITDTPQHTNDSKVATTATQKIHQWIAETTTKTKDKILAIFPQNTQENLSAHTALEHPQHQQALTENQTPQAENIDTIPALQKQQKTREESKSSKGADSIQHPQQNQDIQTTHQPSIKKRKLSIPKDFNIPPWPHKETEHLLTTELSIKEHNQAQIKAALKALQNQKNKQISLTPKPKDKEKKTEKSITPKHQIQSATTEKITENSNDYEIEI